MSPKHNFSIFRGMAQHVKHRDEIWLGTSSDSELAAIDAFNFHHPARTKGYDEDAVLETKHVTDDNLVEWLLEDEQLIVRAREEAGKNADLRSRIRVLICNETFDPQEIPTKEMHETKEKPGDKGEYKRVRKYHMSAESYCKAEEHLDLPSQTMPNLANLWGTRSSEFVFSGRQGQKVSLDITMKTADVGHLSRCGIAVSYDFETKTAKAFVRGLNGVNTESKGKLKNDADESSSEHVLESRFKEKLKRTVPLWEHPLLLPVILLHHELRSVRKFTRKHLQVDANTVAKTLSIDSYDEMRNLLGGRSNDDAANDKRNNFTSGLNCLMRDSISIRRGVQAARECASFLLELCSEIEEMERLGDLNSEFTKKPGYRHMHRNIKGIIKSLDNSAKGYEAGIEAIISSLEVQLNLLSIVASQLDYVSGAEMAAQAGLDSVAMLTLAVVTAVFLPGTFVATLFSMSMFNWQTGADSDRTVSSKFWIFWAIAVPLTVCVLAAWCLWWNVSRVYYGQRFTAAGGVAGSRLEAFKAVLGKEKKRERNMDQERSHMDVETGHSSYLD